ncbi:MAG: D-alanyl-D-alanine carboxypeptidase [Actinomycetia bacterium]|nr:D-alanyl-D-alanine carboxypeptidase [Actinomycetes bacterium]
MPRRRTIAVLTAGLLALGAGGYVAADVYDLAPGVLTLDEPVDPDTLPEPDVEPEPEASGLVPLPVPAVAEPLAAPVVEAPVPDPEGVRLAMEEVLTHPGFYGSAVVVVADGSTGEILYARDPDRAVAPASVQKLLSGAAVLASLDPMSRFTTSAVRSGPERITLVAGGDTMLARGPGDPDVVEGHAGLGDLAEQVIASLTESADPPAQVTVDIDMSYAAGPRYSPLWNMEDIRFGYNQGVTMIGLQGQRPLPFQPSPEEPEKEAVAAFAAALTAAGLPAAVAEEPVLPGPVEGVQLGAVESATVQAITELALDDSDNALTEALTRQASFRAGGPTDFAGVADWVVEQVAALGVDVAGAELLDTSGMTYDQLLPARVVSDLLTLITTGAEPRLTSLVADLPVAGLDGTLAGRYLGSETSTAAGFTRAKTGTINATAALAGTTLSRDGRLLTFVVIADAVPREGRLEARLALDRLATALTECGCHAPL